MMIIKKPDFFGPYVDPAQGPVDTYAKLQKVIQTIGTLLARNPNHPEADMYKGIVHRLESICAQIEKLGAVPVPQAGGNVLAVA